MTGQVIVGGGPAALSTAAGYRKAGGEGDVLMLSADSWPPYARPPLTKDYLRGSATMDDLPLVPNGWYADHRVSLELASAVVDIDTASRNVRLTDGTEPAYDALCLCTGSAPQPMPVPGADLPEVILVRSRQSGDALRGLTGPDHRVMVLGSEFIGCEAAASLAMTGSNVTLVTDEHVPHLARLGERAGQFITEWLDDLGVQLLLDEPVAEIARAEHSQMVVMLASGRSEVVDHVVSGGGAAPMIQLATDAGLRVEKGGILVDSGMHTSDPRVWAAGDVAYAHNETAGRALRVEHWGEAEIMGDIAGRSMAGEDARWDNVPGFWSTIGDHTIKYAAWGDGFDTAQLFNGPTGWAIWYARDGIAVGVLTSDWDSAYDYGREVIARRGSV